MPPRPRVLIGMLGYRIDRQDGWGPTYHACRLLGITRAELICSPEFGPAIDECREIFARHLPDVELVLHIRPDWKRFDLAESFDALYAVAEELALEMADAEYFVHVTTGTYVAQISMFALTEAQRFPAKLVSTENPKDPQVVVIDLDVPAFKNLRRRFSRRPQPRDLHVLSGGLRLRDPGYLQLVRDLELAVDSPFPILLLGEMGTGKTTLAEGVHQLKKRRGLIQGPFVVVNCAQLTAENAESSLFGHVRGAYTGATSDRPGALLEADGGVLFLDEVGTLALSVQQMLLKALAEKTWTPMGATKPVRASFTLICATNEDLGLLVRRGRFRGDLYARIRTQTFRVPALRERLADLEVLFERALKLAAGELERRVGMPAEQLARFLELASAETASWDGNVRELMDFARRLAVKAEDGVVTDAVLERVWADQLADWAEARRSLPPSNPPRATPPADAEGEPPSRTGAWEDPGGEREDRDGAKGRPSEPRLERLTSLRRFLPAAEVDAMALPDAVVLELTLRSLARHRAFAAAERELYPGDAGAQSKNAGAKVIYQLKKAGITRPALVAAGLIDA